MRIPAMPITRSGRFRLADGGTLFLKTLASRIRKLGLRRRVDFG